MTYDIDRDAPKEPSVREQIDRIAAQVDDLYMRRSKELALAQEKVRMLETDCRVLQGLAGSLGEAVKSGDLPELPREAQGDARRNW